jgi:hypothetical protein
LRPFLAIFAVRIFALRAQNNQKTLAAKVAKNSAKSAKKTELAHDP